ncbi:MAG TPA: sugar nucleotide-binding protein [Solirubrobacteraceae bacterium]|jgi:dTDP-4-dehydrorhamnose reductase|nr:sugar nucleotide-binding protein [Solirubrobacteraceae bacterium]
MRVLVTGVGGLIGSNVAAVAAQQSWEVLGCFRSEPVEIEGVRTSCLEMADRKACVEAAMEWEPDVVVHAAGGVALSRFEHDPYIAQLEYVGSEHMLAAARTVRARYVLVSCDWVHSGYRPAGLSFSESDLPDPVNAYGRSKLTCEEATMSANVRWLITRPADVYGVNVARPAGGGEAARYVWEHSGTALRLVKRLRAREALPAPMGLRRSPTYAWDFGQRLCELVAQGCEGVYNMGGPESLGRHEWMGLLADGLGCSREFVREGTNAAYLQACGEDPRLRVPSNAALSDEKARAAIGCAAVAPERGVGLMDEQLRRMLEPNGLRAR